MIDSKASLVPPGEAVAAGDQRDAWTTADSADLYGIDAWGQGYFAVRANGHLVVGPKAPESAVDLKELVDEVTERGITPPLLIRFSDLLEARIVEIHRAFHRAMELNRFEGQYRGVYPIKVNQNRFLLEDLVRYGEPYHFGLEAGSKPELLAVLAMLSDPEALVVCNGYKDEEYIETALIASRLGPEVILVVEKLAELALILRIARQLEVQPRLGMRMRLVTRGAGHWEASGGDRSKFGLDARELLQAVEMLRGEAKLESLVLLHFHLGSQISSIRNLKTALREGSQLYVSLAGMGAPLRYLDVGGGLGVDYAGSQTDLTSSMNYTLQEYANDVVFGVMEVCEPAGVPHPILVTEAGRATVAHHAVLVTEVLGVKEHRIGELPAQAPPEADPVLKNMLEAYRELTQDNVREVYHDVQQYRDQCLSLFNLGHLSLEGRALAEELFGAACRKVRQLVRGMPWVPSDFEGIERALADIYYCNFSVFQSVPDAWAIDQLFPVLPIHRLDEKPDSYGVIADLTCDSDGKIDRFIDPRSHQTSERPVLDLHAFDGRPYYLAVCLVGAYQEILGDLHNLFGDTNTVHVELDSDGGYRIEHVVEGDTVREVLSYVGYPRDVLVARLRKLAEAAIRSQRMDRDQARVLLRRYEEGLAGYTYLER